MSRGSGVGTEFYLRVNEIHSHMKKAGLIQKWPINVLSLLDMTNVPAT